MKNIKKIMLMVLCAVMACCVLASCGAKDKFIGKWKCVAVEEGGKKYTKDDDEFEDMEDMGMVPTITFDDDDTGVMKSGDEKEDFDWEVDEDDDDTVIMDQDGDEVEATLDDDELVIKISKNLKMYFEKDD